MLGICFLILVKVGQILRFERFISKSMSSKEGELLEENGIFSGQFKVKESVKIVGKLGTRHFCAKTAKLIMAEITVIQVVSFLIVLLQAWTWQEELFQTEEKRITTQPYQ